MGNSACIANALRNSLKYGNFDMLEDGYGLNVRPLALFAMEQYGDDPCTNFLPTHVTDCVAENSDVTAKLLKAITVIQFKLEGQLILRHPEYKMNGRLLLDKLVRADDTITLDGKEYRINNISLPTPIRTVSPSGSSSSSISLFCRSCAARSCKPISAICWKRARCTACATATFFITAASPWSRTAALHA